MAPPLKKLGKLNISTGRIKVYKPAAQTSRFFESRNHVQHFESAKVLATAKGASTARTSPKRGAHKRFVSHTPSQVNTVVIKLWNKEPDLVNKYLKDEESQRQSTDGVEILRLSNHNLSSGEGEISSPNKENSSIQSNS